MKLITYQVGQKTGVGVISSDGEWVFPIQSIGPEYSTMLEVIKQISDSEKQLLEYASKQEPYSYRGAARLQEVHLLAPIPVPEQDIICLGINYMDHAEESARFRKREFDGKRPYAVYFSKRVKEATADGEAIPSHEDLVDSLDYEAELAFIAEAERKDEIVLMKTEIYAKLRQALETDELLAESYSILERQGGAAADKAEETQHEVTVQIGQ